MTIEVFPQLPGQGFWAAKGPSWTTTVRKAASGRQLRGSQQGQPIWQFKVGYKVIRDMPSLTEIEQLYAFFNTCAGQLQPFYLLDPFDNTVSNQQVATGDGSTTTFQLLRTGGLSSPTPFVEPIYGVAGVLGSPGGPTILVNGSTPSGSTQIGPLGTLIFSTAPTAGAVITWSGQFYFLCHFTEDALAPAQMMSELWSLDGLPFESLIP